MVGSLVLVGFAVIAILMQAFEPSRDEVVRAESPSGALVAVVYEVNGGATTSFAYEVQMGKMGLVSGATRVAYIYAARRNDHAYGVNLRWVANDELHIEYLHSRWDTVTSPVKRGFDGPIRVELKAGTRDDAAPSGGMLDNLPKL